MSTAVATGIFQKLTGTTAVTSKLATAAAGYQYAIYHAQAPPDSAYPYIIYNKQSGTRTRGMGANAFWREIWMVKAVDRNTTSNRAESISEAVSDALDLGTITVSGRTLADLHHVSDVDYLEPSGDQTYRHHGCLYAVVLT